MKENNQSKLNESMISKIDHIHASPGGLKYQSIDTNNYVDLDQSQDMTEDYRMLNSSRVAAFHPK